MLSRTNPPPHQGKIVKYMSMSDNLKRPGHTSTYICPYCLLSLYYRLGLVLRAYLGHRPLIDTDKKPILSFSIGKDGHFGI